jgi:hypothetical protein
MADLPAIEQVTGIAVFAGIWCCAAASSLPKRTNLVIVVAIFRLVLLPIAASVGHEDFGQCRKVVEL